MTSSKTSRMEDNRKRQELDRQRRKIAQTSSMLRQDSREQVAAELQEDFARVRDTLTQFRLQREQQALAWHQSQQAFRQSLQQNHLAWHQSQQSFRQSLQQNHKALQGQVRSWLEDLQIEREISAETLQAALAKFRLALQQDLRQLLQQMSSDRSQAELALTAELTAHRQDLQKAVALLLKTLTTARAQQAADLETELSRFHEDLSTAVTKFLQTTHSDRVVIAQNLSQMRRTVGDLLNQYRQSRLLETTQMKESLTQFRRRLAQQSAEHVAESNRERQARAIQVRDLQISTQQMLAEAAQTRQIQSAQRQQDLNKFCKDLSSGVDVYLSQCRVDLQQAGQVRVQQATQLREDLQKFREDLHEQVWGEGTPETIAPVPRPTPPKPTPQVSAPPQPSFATSTLGNDGTLEKVYQFVANHPGSRLAEIEAGVGLNRIQIVDALQSLNEQSRITQQDRAYFIVGGAQ